MPTFNWEITLGTLITLGSVIFAAGGIYAFTKNLGKNLEALNKALDTGMNRLDKNVEAMNKVIMDLALSSQRQDNFEKRTDDRFRHLEDDMREMKHGDGYITSRSNS